MSGFGRNERFLLRFLRSRLQGLSLGVFRASRKFLKPLKVYFCQSLRKKFATDGVVATIGGHLGLEGINMTLGIAGAITVSNDGLS